MYATEYGRTGSPARCRAIACGGVPIPEYRRDAHVFGPQHRRALMFIAGTSDWGVYQTPGAVEDAHERMHPYGRIPSSRRSRTLGAAGAAGAGERIAGPFLREEC